MFPCTSHGDAALLELPRGGRRPAFLCNSTALLVSLPLSLCILLIFICAVVAAQNGNQGAQKLSTTVQKEQHVERRLPHLHMHTLRVTLFIC